MTDITKKLEELASAKEFLTTAIDFENIFTNEIQNGYINLDIEIFNFGAQNIKPKYKLKRLPDDTFLNNIIFENSLKICKLIYRFLNL